ncbi:hypothetical protein IVA80_14955 [Bradyrhizobium sp. 139]|nr:hypothetical protein [Bradyrhizobium sp. 139]MCK1742121.1 hypothetical protein [Bradyrhizobium sp. 139]
MAEKRNVWLDCLIALVALLVLGNLVSDLTLDVKYGWDVRVNCAAVDAHAEGLDPYFVKNLKGTKLSYPYLPVTLDAFRPLCAGGFLVGHHRGVFLVLVMLCGLLLPGLGGVGVRDIALRILWALGAFVGFEWVSASGNFAVISGALSAAALTLLLRSHSPGADDDRGFAACIVGAALLGLVASFKLVYSPVLAALYFLPLPRGQKIGLIAAAAAGLTLPILLSRTLYPDLFSSWLLAIRGQIPDQHSIYVIDTTPSLLLLAQGALDHVGLGGSKAIVFIAYALVAFALVLAPFALVVLRMADRQARNEGAFPARLDRWLIDHRREALRITVLAMYGLYLCSPRLKEYAFFELALYGAILIVDLPAAALAAVLTIGVAVPTLVSLSGMSIEGSFVQIAVALVCFWIMLWAQSVASAQGDD